MVEADADNSLGEQVSAVLTGAWRCDPPVPDFSVRELSEVAPLLLGSGGAALGWWRVRLSHLKDSPAALELQHAYRIHTLNSFVHERAIKEVFALLRSAGIEPVLVKGWAIARLYPEKCLRPYGDLDLCFRPEQYEQASDVLESPEGRHYNVDAHEGFAKLDDYSVDELYSRSELIALDNIEVRVLGPEDHLRILCVHLLRHGAFRPSWLCDIAVALENRPADFDWNRCLGKETRKAGWVVSSLALAHRLLGARVDDTPAAGASARLPSWLVAHVLKQWEAPYPALYPPMSYYPPLITYFRHPAGFLKALRKRWPDPLEATIRLERPIDEAPRLPYQIGYCLLRLKNFLASLLKSSE